MAVRARVIVTTYNQVPYLRIALRGYLRQTTRDFRLAIADDGSGPETRAFVEGFAREAAGHGLEVEHVWHEDLGFRRAAVLNAAVRAHRGEGLLVFTDADCIPPATFVERHLAVHEPLSFHVGGGIRLAEEVSATITGADVDAGRHERLATPEDRRDLARRARKSRLGMLFRRRNRPKILGLNVGMDRALFEDLNGFDENFVGYGLEDSDLRDRAMRHQPRPRVKVLYGTNDVIHLWHPSSPGGREANRAYYSTRRPVRCERGLVPPAPCPRGGAGGRGAARRGAAPPARHESLSLASALALPGSGSWWLGSRSGSARAAPPARHESLSLASALALSWFRFWSLGQRLGAERPPPQDMSRSPWRVPWP